MYGAAHKNIKLYRTDTGGSGVLIFCEALDLFCVRTRLIKFFASVRDEQRDWINELRRWLITPPFIQALSERVMTVWCATHHQLLVETKRRKLDPILWLAGGENNLEGGARITTILDLSNLFCGHQLRLTRSLAPSMGFPGIYVCISTLLVPAATHTHARRLSQLDAFPGLSSKHTTEREDLSFASLAERCSRRLNS